jgi:hypothetical protein
LAIIWHGGLFLTMIYPYAFLPFFIKILWRVGFKERINFFSSGLILAILSFFLFPSSIPFLAVSVILSSIIFVLIYLVLSKSSKKRMIIFFISSMAIIGLINSWWIIPTLYSIRFMLSEFQSTEVGTGLNWIGLSGNKGFFRQLLLNNAWTWETGWDGRIFISFSEFYSEIPFLFFSWILLISLCFSSLFKKDNFRFFIIYAVILVCISTFLAKGIKYPFGEVFRFLYKRIPGFYIFRTPDTKFGIEIIFGLSILLSISLYYIYKIKSLYLKIIFSLIILSVILAYSWPFLNGYVIIEKNQGLTFDRLIKIPDFYFDVANYINKDNTLFRTSMFPGPDFTTFIWNTQKGIDGITGPDILADLLINPVVGNSKGTTTFKNSANLSYSLIDSFNFELLPILNVKYMIIRNDTKSNFIKEFEIEPELISNFSQEKKIMEPLELYKVSDEFFLPHIYSSTSPIFIYDSLDEILDEVDLENFTLESKVFILLDQLNNEGNQLVENYNFQIDNPQLTFKKISPVKYHVKLKNIKYPFFLILSDSYNSNWKIYSEKKSFEFKEIIIDNQITGVKEAKHEMRFDFLDILFLFRKSLDERNHFIANGYANSWYIDPENIPISSEEISFTIFFFPQSLFNLGILISISTLAVCIFYLFKLKKIN